MALDQTAIATHHEGLRPKKMPDTAIPADAMAPYAVAGFGAIIVPVAISAVTRIFVKFAHLEICLGR